jgi:hypothetical protein
MSRPGGLQLSPVQIVASLLATLTGAILASYLGVGGTLTGAAVGSIASTTGTEIYRHYLRRSQERLKAAGEVLRHRQEPTGQHARHAAGQQTGTARLDGAATGTLAANQAGQRAARPGAAGSVAGQYNGRGPDTPADPTETQALPAAASAWQRRVGGGPAAAQSAGEHATGELSDGPATGELSDGAAPGGDGSGPWWRNLSRRQWLTYGGVALGVFLVAMVIVTIIELSVGKPLDAAVWGKHSTGTSVGNLVGGSGGHKQQPATSHTSTPTTQPTGTVPNSSPSATPSGTAPTPSTSPSSVPSSGSATPTPGGGQASGQEISPTP